MGTTTRTPALAADRLAAYRADGYTVVESALSTVEIEALRAETAAICRGARGTFRGVTAAQPGETDIDVMRRYLCIHHPHKISPVMRDALRHPAIVAVLTAVIGPNVKAMQSMLFMKSDGKPGQAWHQDEFFIPTRDRSLTAAWIALDDATVDNGCLWVLPGSHRAGVIYPDREHDDERFDCTVEAYDFPYHDSDAVPVEVAAGTAIIFNGYLLHRSLPNTSRDGFRRALANHYMSAESLLPWMRVEGGPHVGKADHRDIELIAGHDPYAYKGTIDHARPSVRPDRSSGCSSSA